MRNLNRKLAVLALAVPGLALAHAAQADHRAGAFYATGGYHHTPYGLHHDHRYDKRWRACHLPVYRHRAWAHDRRPDGAYGYHHRDAHRPGYDRHPGNDRRRHRDDHGYRHSERHDRKMKHTAYAKGYRD